MKDLALAAGCSTAKIRKWVKKHGLPVRSAGAPSLCEFIQRYCEWCKGQIKTHKNERNTAYSSRRFCSKSCVASFKGAQVSKESYATFYDNVKVDENGCFVWQGATQSDGYGVSHHDLAHRVSYQISIGEIGDLYVCHRCDNPPCVNPEHLFLGTQKDNMSDCSKKKRFGDRSGENNANAKMSEATAQAILAAWKKSEETYQALAERFGVSKASVAMLIQGLAWKHLHGAKT